MWSRIIFVSPFFLTYVKEHEWIVNVQQEACSSMQTLSCAGSPTDSCQHFICLTFLKTYCFISTSVHNIMSNVLYKWQQCTVLSINYTYLELKRRRRTKPVDKKILCLTDTCTQQMHTHAHTGGIKGGEKKRAINQLTYTARQSMLTAQFKYMWAACKWVRHTKYAICIVTHC